MLEALVNLFTALGPAISKNTELVLPLLKMLPLIHLLRDDTSLSSPSSVDMLKLNWSDSELKTETLRDQLKSCSGLELYYMECYFMMFLCRLVQTILIDIKDYFALDPLLIPVVVYLCPKDDLPILCDHVPIYMVIAVINHTLSTMTNLKKTEVIKPNKRKNDYYKDELCL